MTIAQHSAAKCYLKGVKFAWQLIAGVRAPVSNSVEIAL